MAKISHLFKIFFLIAIYFVSFSFSQAGTILTDYRYSWSNNIGYINFENVVVTDNNLSGYAWSKNNGWIKFNPTNGGVLNDGSGNLSGYAWGEQLGWINFDNVFINTTDGKFSGTATGTLLGVLTFDCLTHCDVRTDWRPAASVIEDENQNNNSGGFVRIIDGEKIKHVETNNSALTIDPEQSGVSVKDTDSGQIIVEIPINNVKNKTTFYIETENLSSKNQYLVLPELQLINSIFYDIYAKDKDGNSIHNFSYPLTITLPVPINLKKVNNLAVYWLNETNNQWVLIPDAVFSNDKAVFQVDHLTRFAIFEIFEKGQIKTSLPIIENSTENNFESNSNKGKKDSQIKTSLPIIENSTENNFESNSNKGKKDYNRIFFWILPILILIVFIVNKSFLKR